MMSAESLRNPRGATLIEAMIAIMLLTIGILAVMAMQIRAIGASSVAMDQTDANNVATSFLEVLQELPFGDPNLAATGPQLSCSAGNPNSVVTNTNATLYKATNFSSQQQLQIKNIVQQANGAPAGTVTDQAGHTFQLSWTVQNCTFTSGSAAGDTPIMAITVFMNWGSLMGNNQLQITTLKYNNSAL